MQLTPFAVFRRSTMPLNISYCLTKTFRFLKDFILPNLSGNREVKIVPTTRTTTITTTETIPQQSSKAGKGKNNKNANASTPTPAAKTVEHTKTVQVWVWQKANPPPKPKAAPQIEMPYGIGKLPVGMNRRKKNARVMKVRKELGTWKVVARQIASVNQAQADRARFQAKKVDGAFMNDAVIGKLQQSSPTL